jgi:hypothetical protein
MRRRLGVLVIVGAFTAGAIVSAACGGSDESGGPPPLATGGSSSPRDAGARDTGTAYGSDAMSGVEASAGATTYKGTLDTTKAVAFGGDPFCEYTMTLKDIEIEIAALESGEVIGAAVKDLAMEGTVPPCPHPPMAPSMQRFALTTVTKTASGATLAFEGASANRPETSLVIDLTRVGVTFEASAGWKRTDQTPPLVWEVRAKLTLAAQ